MSAPNWPQTWDFRLRHCQARLKDWLASHSTAWTAQKGAPAQYNPEVYRSKEIVQAAEIDCVGTGTCYRNTPTLRKYWKKLDHIVGACSGEQTYYIQAEWHESGAIHGRPVSEAYLKSKGAL
jgi:hypothetical protein